MLLLMFSVQVRKVAGVWLVPVNYDIPIPRCVMKFFQYCQGDMRSAAIQLWT